MTQEYIELLWAEAVHLYKEDFPTYLTYEMEELADKKRESHIKEDPWDSLINAALDNMKSEGIKDFTYAEIYHKAINPQWNTFQHLDKSTSDRLGAIIRKRDDVISISNLYRNNDGEKKRYRGFKLK
ncbi:MAG: virulence-associated E family protein [Bacteroidales bacterium]|nr:virulence-associated E family protein [Bacteroidales bacterium]